MRIALDATYSVGTHLSGVGVYSNEIIAGVARALPEDELTLAYRPHRFLRSFRQRKPANCIRRVLWDTHSLPCTNLFHGLNQRLPAARYPKAVVTVHDLFVITGDYSSAEFRRRFTEQARQAAERSDLVIAVSQFTADQVSALLGVEPSRIRVVPHGVRPPASPDSCARESMILHVGAIQKRKNIGRLVAAFEQLPPGWRLVLAGGRGYGSEEIVDRIERSPARDRIDLPGFVTDRVRTQLYQRAGLMAFPSLDEGFGIPVLEAMAHGVPVLTSNRAALPEVGGDAVWYVNPLEEGDIAAGLIKLTGSEPLRRRLSEKGLKRAATYTWENSAAKTARVYEELLS